MPTTVQILKAIIPPKFNNKYSVIQGGQSPLVIKNQPKYTKRRQIGWSGEKSIGGLRPKAPDSSVAWNLSYWFLIVCLPCGSLPYSVRFVSVSFTSYLADFWASSSSCVIFLPQIAAERRTSVIVIFPHCYGIYSQTRLIRLTKRYFPR